MAAEEALYSRLTGHAGTAALVSTRVYPVRLPQEATLPALTYQRVGTDRETAMGSNPGIARARYQVTSWADDYDGARSVAEQARAALERYRGTVASVEVLDVFLEMELDLYGDEESEAGVFAVVQDFTVIHRE